MKGKIILAVVCLVIGFGLGNVHHSKTVADATKKVEKGIKNTATGTVNTIKEVAESFGEE